MIVLDASAILAFLQGEPGADLVESALMEGGVCSTANWAEVCQIVLTTGGSIDLVAALLNTYGLHFEPVTVEDAQRAAHLWRRESGWSLGDRLCLALAQRLDVAAMTADQSWGSSEGIRQIR